MGQLYYAQTQLYSIVLGVKFSGQYQLKTSRSRCGSNILLNQSGFCHGRATVHLSRVRPTPPTRVDQLVWALVENLREEPKKMNSEK